MDEQTTKVMISDEGINRGYRMVVIVTCDDG